MIVIFSSLALGLAAAQALAPSSPADCGATLAASARKGVAHQAQIDDLMDLRDIGTAADTEPPFTISPDGTRLAVVLRQARAQENDYCQGIVIIDLAKGTVQRPILIGGGTILQSFDLPAISNYGGGTPITLLARWSPDGRSLAYLERRDGVVQIMTAPAMGGPSRQATHSPVDVQDFGWGPAADEIRYTSRPSSTVAVAQIVAEGRRGFRYDHRWVPGWGPAPFPAPGSFKQFSLTLSTGALSEIGEAPPGPNMQQVMNSADTTAQIVKRRSDLLNGPLDVRITTKGGRTFTCAEELCGKPRDIWWGKGNRLLYSIRAGWGDSLTEIWQWDPVHGKRRRLMQTRDRVAGCRAAPQSLVCAMEGSATPRRIVAIDYHSGRQRVVFDPNPQWRQVSTGRITRMHWTNDIGLECYGDLVLPPSAETKDKLPLVIVGYQSRGFLRGGTGDMFPIFPMASHGMAVLVQTRPTSVGYRAPVSDQAEADRRVLEEWADNRSVNSSLLTAIRELSDKNIIDPARIGLTGFSDGVDKAAYSLIHNNIFKAVSMAGCCNGVTTVNMMIGPYLSDVALAMGFPPQSEWGTARTRAYSLAANADRIDTPILIQASDREYLTALELEAARRQRGKPIALFVYPDEYHIFWQPAHRRASYLRNLAWFQYHLDAKGGLPPDLAGWLPDGLH